MKICRCGSWYISAVEHPDDAWHVAYLWVVRAIGLGTLAWALYVVWLILHGQSIAMVTLVFVLGVVGLTNVAIECGHVHARRANRWQHRV